MNRYLYTFLLLLFSFNSCVQNGENEQETVVREEEVSSENEEIQEISEEVSEPDGPLEEGPETSDEGTNLDTGAYFVETADVFKTNNTIPLYSDFDLIEKIVHVEYNDVIEEPEHEDTFQVFIEKNITDSIKLDQELWYSLKPHLKYKGPQALHAVLVCFNQGDYSYVWYQTMKEGYNLVDRIQIFKGTTLVFSTEAHHEDSCADDAASIVGLVNKDSKSYLIIEHLVNSRTVVTMDERLDELKREFFYNDKYNPNTDFRM